MAGEKGEGKQEDGNYTPAIGGVGLIKDYTNMITMGLKKAENVLLVIGKTEGHLNQSLFSRDILNEKKVCR